MPKVQSKSELRDYIYRRLGSPVLNIEVDDIQADDRIDDAVGTFLEYHYAGYEEVFMMYEMTQKDENRQYMVLPKDIISVVELIEPKNRYTGLSGSHLSNLKYLFLQNSYWSWGNVHMVGYYLFRQRMSEFNYIMKPNRQFEFNYVSHALRPRSNIKVRDYKEPIVNVSASPAYVDIDNSIFAAPIDEGDTVWIEESTNNNGEYTVDKVEALNSGDITRVYLTSSPSPSLVESPADGKLHFKDGNMIIIRAYRTLDPDADVDVYDNWWVKDYATALVKKQWADNLGKFEGMQLPNGVSFNTQRMFDEATQEIEQLEQQIREMQEPPHFFMG